MAAVKNLGAVVLAACALVAWVTVAAAAQEPGLHLVVLQGEDGENVIEQGAQVPTLVEVRDLNELPVAGASVVFLLGDGGTATLNAGLREVSLTTNALGQAAVMVNPVAVGLVELSVAATFMGETAEALIVQTNFATAADAEAGVVPVDDPEPAVAPPVVAGRPAEAAGGGGLGTGAILGLAGAGGAVGVGLAVAGGGDSPPPVRPPDPPDPPEPPASVPSRPSAPSISAGDGLLDVSWNAPASNGATINDYDVQYRRTGAAGWEDHPGQFLDRRATIGNLQNGTTYEVRVRAGNSVGKGDWSPSGTGTPVAPASVPSRPSAPSISAGDGLLEVSWNAPASNGATIDDYDVQYRRSGATGWQDHPGQFLDRRATIGNLENGTTYEVRVRAGNSVGKGDWSPSGTGTPVASASVPSAPSAPSVLAGDGLLDVSWSAPASNGAAIDDYDVQYRRSGAATWRDHSGQFLGLNARIGNLENGTTYEVRVRAGNSVGKGDWSPTATGTPVATGDRDALVALYDATNGPTWIDATNWNTTAPLDHWHGVTTDDNGRVITLILTDNGLNGSIPPSIESLTSLRTLNLSGNASLGGPIPESLGRLANLHILYLYNNALTGSIPPLLGNLAGTLTELGLWGNRLSGSIPPELCRFKDTINPQQVGWADLSGCGTDPTEHDRAVLVELYDATNGRNWLTSENWNTDAPLDDWYGVSTDANGRVTELVLGGNELSGTIPAGLGTLANLRVLNLAFNDLRGAIPTAALGNLRNLETLDLGHMYGFSGGVLADLTNLTKLKMLNLYGNGLSGPIPREFGDFTNLETLELSYNSLIDSIPSSLGDLANLSRLGLVGNRLTGSIPTALCRFADTINPQQGDVNLPGCGTDPAEQDRAVLVEFYNATDGPNWTNNANWNTSAPLEEWHGVTTNENGRVRLLWLKNNQLSGSIPSSLGGLTDLGGLELEENQLSGSIPSELGNLTSLGILYLWGNQLSGSIPSELGNLRRLDALSLEENQLSGSIPDELGDLTNLTWLSLRGNRLTGKIPEALCRFVDKINPQQGGNLPGCGTDPAEQDRAVLVEFYNATDGPNWTNNTDWNSSESLDHWYGVSTDHNGRVTALSLHGNQLSGSMPPSLGNLTNLRELYLYYNQLSGEIPPSLGNLTNLTVLDLDTNQLSGEIPLLLGNLTNLTELYLNSSELTGEIPLSFENLTNLDALWLYGNRLRGSIPAALCRFESDINPQQGDVYLPCEGSSANVAGLARLSVADAEAEENVDNTIDFTVTLERAVSGTVSVDYTTEDGSAQAGADYTATSGTLTFSAGERSKTVRVDLLDDAHDEGEETFTLVLSNPAGGVIVDGRATGRIENHDPLPRALMARFGRTAAVHVVEQVEERLQAPREPGVEGRFAGQELRPGMERDLASRLLGGAAGPLGGAASPLGGAASPLGGVPGVMGGMAGPLGGVVPGVMGGAAAPGAAAGLMQPGGVWMASGGLGGSMAGGRGLLDMAGGDMLTGSAFAVNRETRRGGVLSFWSRGARSSFTGREGALALGGDVRTTMFGADYAKGPLVVGLSLSNSRGLGEYGGTGDGVVASSVTGLYPWLGYKATDRVTVWGVAGYGAGGLMLTPGGGPALESGLSMAMAAGGTRGELIGGGSGGFGLAFKADALWVGTSLAGVDGPAGRLAATEAAVTRFRTGLEGSREFVLGGRVSLRPSAEVGLRHDGGDAETGAGMDVGGGLVLADSVTGLSVDLRVRTLVAHQAEGFRERGMALSFSFDPTPSTPLGFTARVAPAWGGQATGGAEALWGRETLAGLADGGFASGDRLDAEVGYGLPLGSRFVGTPRMGFAATEYGRDYRMGYGVTLLQRETLDFELGVDARRRESWTQGGADSGFLGRATLGW